MQKTRTTTILKRGFFAAFDFRKFSRKNRIHFFINLLIGLLIILLFHFIEDTNWGESALDAFLDRFVLSEAVTASREKKDIQEAQILFVDIDNQTFKSWGEPLITPRDKIAEIIDLAYIGKAKVIVLDILLEDKDCCNPEGAQRLLTTLKNIISDKENESTKIILAQSVDIEMHLKRSLIDDLDGAGDRLYQGKKRKIYRAATQVGISPSDNVVRYWNVYQTYLNSAGQKKILLGIPILAALLFTGNNLIELDNYCKQLLIFGPRGPIKRIYLGEDKKLKLSQRKSDRYLQRIRFNLIPEMGIDADNIDDKKTFISNLDETKIAYDEIEYYKGFFKDKIIVIGNSSIISGDIHKTPIGKMAGMYIHGNAIHTLLNARQPTPPPAIISLLLEAVLIVLAAYAFLYFTALLAQILVSIVIVSVLGLLSYLLFIHTGIFLNFVFALIGMGFHETASDIEEIFEKKGRK